MCYIIVTKSPKADIPTHKLRFLLRRFKERSRNALLPDQREAAKVACREIEEELNHPDRQIRDEEPPF